MPRRLVPAALIALALSTAAVVQAQGCGPCLDVAPPPDGDGWVNIGDVVRILRFSAGVETPTADEVRRADVAPAERDDWAESVGAVPVPVRVVGDASVDVADVVQALRINVGLDTLRQREAPVLLAAWPLETCLGAHFTVSGRALVVGSSVAEIRLGELPTESVRVVAADPPRTVRDVITVREVSGRDPATWTRQRVDVFATAQEGVELVLPEGTTVRASCEEAPVIDSVAPPVAYAGQSLSLSGSGLACVQEVAFREPVGGEERPAGILSVSSGGGLSVRVPESFSGDVEELEIVVRSACGEGQAPPGFLHLGERRRAVPDAVDIVPAQGLTGGGNIVQVFGPHVGLADAVFFGARAAVEDSVVRQAWDELLVIVPASGGEPWEDRLVDVVVVQRSVEDPTPLAYDYLAAGSAPECDTVSPADGSVAGGDDLIITAALGSNLDPIDEVRFGGVAAPTVLGPSPGVLAVVTPAYPAAEAVAVELLRDGEVLSTCPMPFTYR